MKKFGFGKKDKSSSAAGPTVSNPYAVQTPTAQDPYAAPDTNKYANMGSASPYQQPRSNGASYGLPSGPGAKRAAGGYGAAPPAADTISNGNAYGANKYGSGGGYGSNRYDSPASNSSASRYGAGGYGGMGGSESTLVPPPSTGGPAAPMAASTSNVDKYGQKPSPTYSSTSATDSGYGPSPTYSSKSAADNGYGPSPTFSAASSGGVDSGYGGSGSSGSAYGGYGEERELTQEELEEEEVRQTKQDIRRMKQEDVASTRNALRLIDQSLESGMGTMTRLAEQGERLHNTERNLDLALSHNRTAEEKTKELNTLNKSMFAVRNPLTSRSRQAAREAEILERHRTERDEREQTRQAAYKSSQQVQGSFRNLEAKGGRGHNPYPKPSLADRSRYQFEADSEDEAMENELDENLSRMGNGARQLNLLAGALGDTISAQNPVLDRVSEKGDKFGEGLSRTQAKLNRIH